MRKPNPGATDFSTHRCGSIVPRVVTAVALVIALGCDREPERVKPGAPPANVVTPVQRSVQDYDEFVGRVEAVESVDLRARVSGYLLGVNFKDGDVVTKGQPLLQIDPAPIKAQFDRATAALAMAQAQHRLNESTLASLKAAGTSASQLEVNTAASKLAESDAAIQAANAQIEATQVDLDYTVIKSPIAGRIGATKLSVGNLVGPDALLTTVVSIDPIYVSFDVDERRMLLYRKLAREKQIDVARIRDAEIPVYVALADERGFPHKGVLEFVDNQIDRKTGTIHGRATFDNSPRFLVPGQFVSVRLPRGDAKPVLLVPDRAVGRDQDRRFLLLVGAGDVVERREVQVSGLYDEGMRAVSGGLRPDERVIVDGIQQARPGKTVVPTLVVPPSTAPSAGAPTTTTAPSRSQ